MERNLPLPPERIQSDGGRRIVSGCEGGGNFHLVSEKGLQTQHLQSQRTTTIRMIMTTTISKFISLQLLSLILFLSIAPCTFGQQYEPYYVDELCNTDNNFTPGEGVGQLLQNLKTNSSFPSYATSSNDSQPLYALLQCRRDLSQGECERCSTAAATNLNKNCSQQVDAMIWYDGCFLRYDNKRFFSTLDTDDYIDFWNITNSNDPAFAVKTDELIRALDCEAQSSELGFAMGSINYNPSDKIFGLVQCNQDLTMDNCSQCLKEAVTRILGPCQQSYGNVCQSKVGRRVLMKNCYIQYELTMFYHETSEGLVKAPSNKKCKGGSNKTLYYVLGGVGGGVLFLGLIFFRVAHNRKKRSPSPFSSLSSPVDEEDPDVSKEELPSIEMEIFSWDTIVAATNNFSIENKLGEGGFGIVYLGKLVNGREVAVKKLSLKSDQGRKEFLNEVGLVAKLQHRNLARLVGCCVEGQERLLLYEYMRNSSLDTILFDPSKKSRLDWESRLELIMGIARGLLYLHEDSAFHVIHRDIKAANVLLDDQLHPKIADFGMAHLFSIDRTLIASRVAGTLGYMAPEYVMHGMLSTKVDIYSYGVLILEIISGRRNNDPTLPVEGSRLGLVGWASTLQREGRSLELIDPDLGENRPEEFVVRCINVALLCTESMSSKRPLISGVLMMLSSNSVTLPGINSRSSSYSSATNQTAPLLLSYNGLTITEESGR